MKESAARTVATAALVSAGVVAGYVVLTRPPLRRVALLGLRLWLGASVSGYVLTQVSQAWAESGRKGLPRPPG
jgi:hypothetical protein